MELEGERASGPEGPPSMRVVRDIGQGEENGELRKPWDPALGQGRP